jgi:hypothetical protein
MVLRIIEDWHVGQQVNERRGTEGLRVHGGVVRPKRRTEPLFEPGGMVALRQREQVCYHHERSALTKVCRIRRLVCARPRPGTSGARPQAGAGSAVVDSP